LRILFVDDNAVNRQVVGAILAAAEIEMSEAEDAETGLRMIGEDDFDIVLMDIRMPGMDGLTATRRLRARSDGKANIPVIVVTADSTPTLRADCLACGANDLVMKPVAMDILFDALGRILASENAVLV
jgi:CheY-like chemotaxis protein